VACAADIPPPTFQTSANNKIIFVALTTAMCVNHAFQATPFSLAATGRLAKFVEPGGFLDYQ